MQIIISSSRTNLYTVSGDIDALLKTEELKCFCDHRCHIVSVMAI